MPSGNPGKSKLREHQVHGQVIGRAVPLSDAELRSLGADRHDLKLAEILVREYAALTSYLRDSERRAGRGDNAEHYANQASMALSLAPLLRGLWAGDLSMPVTLAEQLMRHLEALLNDLQAYGGRTRRRPAAMSPGCRRPLIVAGHARTRAASEGVAAPARVRAWRTR